MRLFLCVPLCPFSVAVAPDAGAALLSRCFFQKFRCFFCRRSVPCVEILFSRFLARCFVGRSGWVVSVSVVSFRVAALFVVLLSVRGSRGGRVLSWAFGRVPPALLFRRPSPFSLSPIGPACPAPVCGVLCDGVSVLLGGRPGAGVCFGRSLPD